MALGGSGTGHVGAWYWCSAAAWLLPNLFVHTLGRAFMGAAAAVFLSGALVELLHRLAGAPAMEQALVGRWLMAWGDAFLTDMFTAISAAFAPQ